MKGQAGCALVLLACWGLGGCTLQAAPSDEDLQSLCGPSSKLRDVEFYDGSMGVPTAFVNRHRLAVGLLRWKSDLAKRYLGEAGNVSGQGWCTGTLIDDDLFLTAGHCLDNDDTGTWQLPREKDSVLLRPSELAREFVVEFRYETSLQADAPTNRAEVVRLEEYRNGGLDYAILRLSGHPGLHNGVARIAPDDASAGTPIAILQHPAAGPMKIGAGEALRVEGSTIAYDTIDTLGGSSGAGVLDATTGKLVGVHTNGGCTKSGNGENFGVTIAALTAVSDILSRRVDRSKDFLVGDWNNDGLGDLAVFHQGCLYPDANHDGERDAAVCPVDSSAEQYFVGNWQPGQNSQLGWRRAGCVYLDTSPRLRLCYGAPPFEVMVADWNDDGLSDLGIRKGRCIDFDTNLDGVLDAGYCYGTGFGEDEYLAGKWDGEHDSIATRRGNEIAIDLDRDGAADITRVYGEGGNSDQYLVGDWNRDQHADLGYRRNSLCHMDHDADGIPNEGRAYHDFWSEP